MSHAHGIRHLWKRRALMMAALRELGGQWSEVAGRFGMDTGNAHASVGLHMDRILDQYERMRVREYVAMTEAPDFPFYDVLSDAVMRMQQGHTIYQKFTCQGCGQRLTVETPNKFYKNGVCPCGTTTDIIKEGCNFLMIMKGRDRAKVREAGGGR